MKILKGVGGGRGEAGPLTYPFVTSFSSVSCGARGGGGGGLCTV